MANQCADTQNTTATASKGRVLFETYELKYAVIYHTHTLRFTAKIPF